jgi:hypothetical protein
VWGKILSPEEKIAIGATCERFIVEVLKPRFLPDIRPTTYNYPIDIRGRWRGSQYSFVTRYRSGFPDNAGEEFDAAFTRLDHVAECVDETRLDVMCHRHTGQWWRVHSAIALDAALRLIESEPPLRPNL